MKKLICIFLITVFSLSFLTLPAYATENPVYDSTEAMSYEEADNDGASLVIEEVTEFVPTDRILPLVVDNANFLSVEAEEVLLKKCEDFTRRYKAEIAIVTTLSLEGKTAEAYADDYYDYNGYGYGENDDGLLVVYCKDENGKRDLYISTFGTAREAISDDEISEILMAMKDFLVAENYTEAFDTFISMSETAITPPSKLAALFVCLVIGVIIGFVILRIIASGNRSVRKKYAAADYVRQGSFTVTGHNDVYVRSRVKTVPKPKANSSSQGSSSHTSSSGRSHGGGGISF